MCWFSYRGKGKAVLTDLNVYRRGRVPGVTALITFGGEGAKMTMGVKNFTKELN
jgi:hypothetical protein